MDYNRRIREATEAVLPGTEEPVLKTAESYGVWQRSSERVLRASGKVFVRYVRYKYEAHLASSVNAEEMAKKLEACFARAGIAVRQLNRSYDAQTEKRQLHFMLTFEVKDEV